MDNFTGKSVKEMLRIPGVTIDVNSLMCDTPLKDQGVDSLEMMNLVLAIEEKLDFKIPDEDIGKMTSLIEIASYLNERLNNARNR
jgi:acyl carrier protein